jgi:16S rRNA (uracil1498-N3)-methyltransferase
MKQFILPVPPNADGTVRLYGDDYRYLVRVRRLKEGAVFPALLPGGIPAEVTVLSTVDGILIGECKTAGASARRARDGLPAPGALPPIILFQGLPRSPKMDLIVRQAAEGGLTEIAPFVSGFSTVKLKDAGTHKIKRWERIIKEARQQSGSVIDTALRQPCTIDGILEYWNALKTGQQRPVGIILHQEPLEKGSFHDYLYNRPTLVVFAVGPEGGFSTGEAARFMEAGFKPLLMGGTILRTETAALYGAAAIRVLLLESASWAPVTARPIHLPE